MNSVSRTQINKALANIINTQPMLGKVPASAKKTAFMNDLQDYIHNNKGNVTDLENKLAFVLGFNIVEG